MSAKTQLNHEPIYTTTATLLSLYWIPLSTDQKYTKEFTIRHDVITGHSKGL